MRTDNINRDKETTVDTFNRKIENLNNKSLSSRQRRRDSLWIKRYAKDTDSDRL